MNERLTEISKIAASGLKGDAELCMAVQREIEDHFATTMELAADKGIPSSEALESTIAKFGSPAEAADAVLAANKKRLKLRARCRVFFIGVLPFIALLLGGWSISTVINRLMFERQRQSYTPRKEQYRIFATAVGIDFAKLPEQQKWLLECKWDELHAALPDDKAYSSRLFMKNLGMRSWRNSKPTKTKIDHKNYNKFVKLDPDNALYDYMHAAEILYSGSTLRPRHSSGKIVDRLKLMEALPFYLRGLRKGEYNNYTAEIKRRQMQLAFHGESAAIKAWNGLLSGTYLPDNDRIEYIFQALPMWVDELIKAGEKAKALELLETWKLLLYQIYSTNTSPITRSRALGDAIYIFSPKLPKLYKKLGQPGKAAATALQLNSLQAGQIKRYGKKGMIPGRDKAKKDFIYHTSNEYNFLGWYLLPGEYNIEDYAPARTVEYTIADKVSLQLVVAMLMVLIIGSALCYLLIKWHLKRTMSPSLFALSSNTIWKLILFGVIIPIGLWYAIGFCPYSGRDYSLAYNSLNYFLQTLFLISIIVLWPIALQHYYIERKILSLGIEQKRHSKMYYLTVPLIISGILFIAALLPWYNWQQFDFISTLLGMRGYEMRVGQNITKIIEWYWIAPIPAAILLWLLTAPLFKALFLFNKSKRLFVLGSISATLMSSSSLLLIAMLVVANTLLPALAEYYTKQNTIKLYQGFYPLPLYKIREADGIYKGKIIERLQKKVPVPVIDDTILESYRAAKALRLIKNRALQTAAGKKNHALSASSRNKNVKVIKKLLAAGAKVNFRDKRQMTPLMWAAKKNPDPQVVEFLVKRGAKLEAGDVQQATALMFATRNPNRQVFYKLLKLGAKLNAQDDIQQTVYMRALERFPLKDIKKLEAMGVDTTVVCSLGTTNLMYATANKDTGVIKHLLDNGAEIDAVDDTGATALFYACMSRGYPAAIETLLNNGASPKIKNKSGRTVLYYAEKKPMFRGTNALNRLRKSIGIK